jgi:DnaJ-class molecular chaperone
MDGYKTYDASRGHGTPREWRSAFNATMGLDEAKATVGTASPFELLGVPPSATWSQVRSAYRARALECHPDRCAVHGLAPDVATARFKRLTAAYTVIAARLNP